MGEDEAATLTALKKHKAELIDPKAFQYGGRIIKLMGDGVLMEFGSVVEAVNFAVEMQCAMRDRNAEVPEQRQILYRIGINTGDVIVEGDDIYGDGVNIAVRLEGLAEPGGICVARNVRDQINDKLDLNFYDLGEVQVKNIVRPVPAFRVLIDEKSSALQTPIVQVAGRSRQAFRLPAATTIGLAVFAVIVAGLLWSLSSHRSDSPQMSTKPALPSQDKPSIAVLPFLNLSGTTEQRHFADGISDDLTTQLSRVSGLFVISRTTAFQYRDRSVDLQKVAKNLGIRYVLEGSVRREAQKIRVNAQLVDAKSGVHVWAQIFDGSVADPFALQDEINAEIVSALKIKLTTAEKAMMQHRGTKSVEAYDAFMRAERYRVHSTKTRYTEAIAAYREAIAKDPNFGAAYAGLGFTLWRRLRFSGGNTGAYGRDEEHILELANRAKALGEHPLTHILLANIQLFDKKDHAHAQQQARRALDIDPNNPEALLTLATILLYVGQAKIAEQTLKKAMRRDPNFSHSYPILEAQISFENRRYQDTVDKLSEICGNIVTRLHARTCRFYLASSYGHLDEVELGLKELRRTDAWHAFSPEDRLSTYRVVVALRFPFKNVSSAEHLLSGIQIIVSRK